MANDYSGSRGQTTKKAISIILSFLAFIFLTCITLLVSIYLNLFEPHTVLKAIRESDFYAGAKAQFEETAWDITIPLGLPQTVVTDLVSSEQIKQDVDTGVYTALNNKAYTPDTASLRETIETRVTAHFSSQGKSLSENQQQVLSQYKDSLAEEYTQLITIPLLSYCGGIKAAYSKLIFIALAVLVVFLVLCVVLILLMRRHKHRGMRYLIYATSASAVASGILPIFLFASGFHGKINLQPAYFKTFVVKYIDQYLYMLLTFSLVFVLVTAVLFLLIHLSKRRMNRPKGMHTKRMSRR